MIKKTRFLSFSIIKCFCCLICLFGSLSLASCNKQFNKKTIYNNPESNKPCCIKDLCYDINNLYGYRIYINENNEYVPFLVLSSDYSKNCLLLREFLLDEPKPYNSSGEYGSYYSGSIIDDFLNNSYFYTLHENTRKIIVNSSILIATKNAIDTHDSSTETIERKIFLLSATEVNSTLGSSQAQEGIPINFFKKNENKIAYYENSCPGSWMLRSAAFNGGNSIVGISETGCAGIGGINGLDGLCENAVRPAFCIPIDTEIEECENIIGGEKVFILKN